MRLTKTFVLVFVTALFLNSLDAAQWCQTPLSKWTEAVTVDSCTEAMPPEGPPKVIPADHRIAVPVPEPPYGTWKEKIGTLTATGLTNCWSTRLMPGDDLANAKITMRFTVDKSCGAARQLPGGCVRWGFHWGENLPGWDVGVVLRYKDPLNFYRLQLSASRGELAFWDSTGGFLQLIPCSVELGKEYNLEITTRGAHFTVSLDGKPVMDYWDRTLPHERGRCGLAVWKSTTRFDHFRVERLDDELEVMPPHQPNFRFEPTHNILGGGHPAFHQDPQDGVILFDGYEPVSCFWKSALNKDKTEGGCLFQETVKFKPGWRPTYYTCLGPTMSGRWPTLIGELPEALKVEGGGETISFNFQTEEPKVAHTDYTCMVRYDATRGVYRYEYRGKLRILGPKTLNESELFDPLTYNNRAPGPEVVHRWNPAGHRWNVFQGPSGEWQRYSIVDYLVEYNNPETKWGKFNDFLYPDPAACPAFETEIGWEKPQGRFFKIGQCTWGYDFHHAEVGRNFILPTDSERPFAMTFTALPPEEADKLFAQSRLPEKVLQDKNRLIPFDPSGDTFTKTTTWQDPSATMLWNGLLDETVGRTDKSSLRLDGPGGAGVFLYQYMIEQYAKRWWIRGWFKTKGVRGTGLKLRVKYSYGKDAEDVFYLGGLGNRDWTYFSFIATAFRVRDCSNVDFELDGPGQVWLDDIAISALMDNAKPKTTVFKRPENTKPRKDLLIDLPMSEQPDKAVFDESYNGHSLLLKGPTWQRQEGRGVLCFDGLKDVATISLKSALEPRNGPPGDSAYRPLFALDEFTYEFWVRPHPPAIKGLDRMIIFHSRFNPLVYFDQLTSKPGECRFVYQNNVYHGAKVVFEKPVSYGQWLHVVATHGHGKVTLYLNGAKSAEADFDPKSPGFDFSGGEWSFSIGAWRYGGGWLTGELGPFRLYARALTAKDVAERYQKGWTKSL